MTTASPQYKMRSPFSCSLIWILSTVTISFQLRDPDMVLVLEKVPPYQGQSVHIDCAVRGSEFLSWRSSEYVGAEPVQVRVTSPQMTTDMGAVISVLEANEQMLKSRLEFNVSTNGRYSSVTCRNIDQNRENSINITSRDVNAILLTIVTEKEKFCVGDEVEVECTAKGSPFIQWEVDGNTVFQCLRLLEANHADVPQVTCSLKVTIHEGLNQVGCRNVEESVTDTKQIQGSDSDACKGLVRDAITTTVSAPQPTTGERYVYTFQSKASRISSGGWIIGILCTALIMTH